MYFLYLSSIILFSLGYRKIDKIAIDAPIKKIITQVFSGKKIDAIRVITVVKTSKIPTKVHFLS